MKSIRLAVVLVVMAGAMLALQGITLAQNAPPDPAAPSVNLRVLSPQALPSAPKAEAVAAVPSTGIVVQRVALVDASGADDQKRLPASGSALPLLAVIGFGVLLGGIASAMRTRAR